MPITSVDDTILDVIKENGPITTKEITEILQRRNISVTREYINSILYGYFREVVVRERNHFNVPTWRIKTQRFEAGKGYEARLLDELIQQKVIRANEAFLDFKVSNRRTRKIYHLDIALFKQDKKYDIEVDGVEHMRADARLSIQNQIRQKGQNTEIDIDWMDNKTSYIDFKKIDGNLVTKWCNTHLSWCITYHEELIWPHDLARNMWLIENGWSVMRLWNIQVKNNLRECVEEIKDWIKN